MSKCMRPIVSVFIQLSYVDHTHVKVNMSKCMRPIVSVFIQLSYVDHTHLFR